MFGLLFSKRLEDQHWWDDDALVRARNVDFEQKLDELVEDYGVPDPRTPQRNGNSDDMMTHPLIGPVLKFGVIPGAFLWLLYLLTGSVQSDVRATRESLQAYVLESRAATASAVERFQRIEQRTESQQVTIVNLLRAQCINLAKSQQERNNCLEAGGR